MLAEAPTGNDLYRVQDTNTCGADGRKAREAPPATRTATVQGSQSNIRTINYTHRPTLLLIFKLAHPSSPAVPPIVYPDGGSQPRLLLSRLQASPPGLPFLSTVDICRRTILFFFFKILPPFITALISPSIIYCISMCQSHCWCPSVWSEMTGFRIVFKGPERRVTPKHYSEIISKQQIH